MALLLHACGDSPSDSGTDSDPVTVTWEPVEAVNRMPYRPTLQLSGGDGFEQVRIQSAHWDTLIDAGGAARVHETFNKTYQFSKDQVPATLEYIITAGQSGGGQVVDTVLVEVAYENPAPDITLQYQPRVFDRSQQLSVVAEDLYGLESVSLEVEGQTYHIDGEGQTRLQQTIPHTYSGQGETPVIATATDTDGQTAADTRQVYVVPKFDYRVGSRGFWEKGDASVSFTLTNVETGDSYDLSGSGVLSQEVFEGPHIISDVEGEFYKGIGRIKVDRDLHPNEEQYWHGQDHTYLASGREGTPWLVNITKNTDSNSHFIETLDKGTNVYTGQDLLENFSRLSQEDFLILPKAWETQYIVLNTGNPDWPDDFDIWDDFLYNDDVENVSENLPGGGRYPPGTSFTDDEINNFREYVIDLKNIFNSDVVGINPFNIEVVEDSAENLTDFFTRGPPYRISEIKDNVQYIGGNGNDFKGLENLSFSVDDASSTYFIRNSRMLVPGVLIGFNDSNSWFSNEDNHWGINDEAWDSSVYEDGPVCSVKDHTSATRYFPSGPDFCISLFGTPDRRSFKPLDVLMRQLSAGVGAFSGRQLNKDYFENTTSSKMLDDVENNFSNVSSSYKGFNVYLLDSEL